MATLTMAENCPSEAEVSCNLWAGFSCVCSISEERSILGADLYLTSCKNLLDHTDVDGTWCYNYFDFVAIEGERFQDLCWELSGEVNTPIALPVSAY